MDEFLMITKSGHVGLGGMVNGEGSSNENRLTAAEMGRITGRSGIEVNRGDMILDFGTTYGSEHDSDRRIRVRS